MIKLPTLEQHNATGVVMLLATAAIFFHPFIHSTVSITNIVDANQLYLSNSEHKSITSFLLLSEISALLAMVSSSEVGISFIANFNVSIGNALQVFSDLVDRGLAINLLSIGAIKILQLINNFSDCLILWLSGIILCIGFGYFFLLALFKDHIINQLILSLFHKLFLLMLILHIAVPYSIHISASTSHYLLNDIKQHNESKLLNLHHHTLKEKSHKNPKDRAKQSIHSLEKLTTKSLPQKIENVIHYILAKFIYDVFELILMPFGVLYLLYTLLRKISHNLIPPN